MSNFKNVSELRKLLRGKQLSTSVTSINDLREKEYSGQKLSEDEQRALVNYEHYRLTELNKLVDDAKFNEVYQILQVMANLRPYQDFLEEKFNSK